MINIHLAFGFPAFPCLLCVPLLEIGQSCNALSSEQLKQGRLGNWFFQMKLESFPKVQSFKIYSIKSSDKKVT